ncbi:MAG: PKD domain-containing protein, partial [Verrucomicrobiaceae bacterium]
AAGVADWVAAHPAPALSEPARVETLAGFAQWLESYSAASASERTALAAEGLALARERRVEMESLIRNDPRRALAEAVTLDVWQSLPAELRAEVEEPFSAMARYQVLPVCGSNPTGAKRPDAVRLTRIGSQPPLDTHVFGKRLGITSKEKAPVQGIRLGGLAALHEGTFRKLSAEETRTATPTYPLANPHADRDFATGEALGDTPVTALAGGKVFLFANDGNFESFADAVDALDKSPAPQGGSSLVFLPYPANGTGGFNLTEVQGTNRTLESSWTATKKKVLMIRCDFSDKPDSSSAVPVKTEYETLLNGVISNTIRDYSYGKTWIEATVSDQVIRLPQPSTYYAELTEGSSRNTEILDDAKAGFLGANNGFPIGDYQIVGVWFTEIGMWQGGGPYSGLAGGTDLWIQGTKDTGVHVHEFGHNYGILHSSFWQPSENSTDPLDPLGNENPDEEEYGDPFDVMGKGPAPEGVFHSQAKQLLHWLTAGEWVDTTAAGNGIYRLNRIDHPDTTGVRGLRVTKGADDYLWLSYRRLFENKALKAGANIVWERAGFDRSWLIDTTVGSQSGKMDRTDGSLAIGRTLTTGNSHITPLARGGSGADEWLDVRVNTGAFPGNTAPSVTLAGPSTIGVRQTAVFTAQASDPNGDALAYSWDFGQGFTFDNHPTATFAWTIGGTFTVKVTVSDMKGQTAEATKTVAVTGDSNTWSTRANTSVGTFHALAASPNKVIAVGEQYAPSYTGPVATSTDGTNWTATVLGLNEQAYGAIWDGSQFLIAGRDFDPSIAPSGAFVGMILTSPTADAGSWTNRLFTGSRLNGIAYGNGVHIAVGDNGTIRRSTNGGLNWTLIPAITPNRLNSVSYGGGKFVAVGYDYFPVEPPAPGGRYNGNVCVLTSSDGLTWTDTSAAVGFPSNAQDLRYIRWTHDRFLASGWYGTLRTSTDFGASFSTSRVNRENLPAFAYGNGIWFAAGFDHDNGNADIDLVSADGVNWIGLATPALDNRNAAIFFNNTFITAGENHSIRQSSTIAQGTGGFYAWRESNLPNHGPQSTPAGDEDGDGVTNLIEYALGRSPNSGTGNDGPASLPQALVTAGEPELAGRLVLQASLPEPAAPDVVHVIEGSSTLTGSWTTLATKTGAGSWIWNAGGTSRIVTSAPSSGRVTVKVGDSVTIADGPARFLRLRAHVNP